jgi:hypothetical protein
MDLCWAKRTEPTVNRRASWWLRLALGVTWPLASVSADDPPARQAATTRPGSQVDSKPAAPAPTLLAEDAAPKPRSAPAAAQPTTQPKPSPPPSVGAQPAPSPPSAAGPALHVDPRTLAQLKMPTAVPVEAGVITRAELQAELGRGVARFLRQVRTQPVLERGRFVGWRLISLFPQRPDIHVKALRAGDTVLRVNGRSLERPEELQALWDSLAQADELLIELRGEAGPRTLRFAIGR